MATVSEKKLGLKFKLKNSINYGKITEIFALGFHYHTVNDAGDCIEGQKYMTHRYYEEVYLHNP